MSLEGYSLCVCVLRGEGGHKQLDTTEATQQDTAWAAQETAADMAKSPKD